ncbi:MAG: hypothetical protein FWD83_09315 [Promicromonosporaceae bacterium]|nr:hypothetical protein [Promicromonosporaceae bacterium]
MPTLTLNTGDPARVTIRHEDGMWHLPSAAIRDSTTLPRPGVVDMDQPGDTSRFDPGYIHHFLSDGVVEVSVPRGEVTIAVEHGPEYFPARRRLDVRAGGAALTAIPERFADLGAKGWWSGDLHLHRPLADAELILRAENLNLGAFVTRWTGRTKAHQLKSPTPEGVPATAATLDLYAQAASWFAEVGSLR